MKNCKKVATLATVAILACCIAAIACGCSKEEEPSYQAVVVSEQQKAGEIYCVQIVDGEMSSGLIVLTIPENTTADPSQLTAGDVINVYGSEQIAMSYPGQANCTDISLSNERVEGDAYAPFEAEWQIFEGRLAGE